MPKTTSKYEEYKNQVLTYYLDGMKPEDVAKIITDVPLTMLKYWYYYDKKFQEQFHEGCNKKVVRLSPAAIRAMEKCLGSANEWVQMQAANSILKLAGVFNKNESESQVVIKLDGAPNVGMPASDGNDTQADSEKKDKDTEEEVKEVSENGQSV